MRIWFIILFSKWGVFLNNNYIEFPRDEYSAYLDRLNNNKIIYTTRVSSEVNRYKLGCIYDSYFGKIKVVYLEHFSNIKDHPFIDELSDKHINEINKYINDSGFDLVGLSKIWYLCYCII